MIWLQVSEVVSTQILYIHPRGTLFALCLHLYRQYVSIQDPKLALYVVKFDLISFVSSVQQLFKENIIPNVCVLVFLRFSIPTIYLILLARLKILFSLLSMPNTENGNKNNWNMRLYIPIRKHTQLKWTKFILFWEELAKYRSSACVSFCDMWCQWWNNDIKYKTLFGHYPSSQWNYKSRLFGAWNLSPPSCKICSVGPNR